MEIVIEQRRWMDIVIEQWCALEDAKQKKARAGCRNHSSTTTASQPKKADIIQCAHVIFCWGSVRDTLARRMPYEMLVPRCEGILQRVNCHSIRALCAPSVLPCGSCRMVMDGSHLSLHLHTVISKEFCWRAFARSMLMSHSAMGHHKLVCFCLPCALCFLSLCTLKS